MQCPKCRTKLMIDEKKSSSEIYARCVKCAKEFIVKDGRMEQRRRRKGKGVPKGVTITKVEDIESSTDPALKQHQKIMKQMKQVQALNKISRSMKKPK